MLSLYSTLTNFFRKKKLQIKCNNYCLLPNDIYEKGSQTFELDNAHHIQTDLNNNLLDKNSFNVISLNSNEIASQINPNEKSNKSTQELFKLGLVYFAIELLFSIEIALTVPLMLKLKVSEDIYSFVYFISPLVGFLVQPILGAYSDKCGQRKPFIFTLAMGAYAGIFLILNGYIIGQNLGDRGFFSPVIGISLVGIGVTVLDFSADSCDSPLRAYLLDICNLKAQEKGLNIHAFLGGLGSSLGFVLTYIEWDKTIFNIIGDELQILYLVASIIFVICLSITMSTIKESTPNSTSHSNDTSFQLSDISIRKIQSSFSNIPKELKRLLICQTIGWLALFSTQLFFTDFIAQSIYKGDPYSSIESSDFKQYNTGVKMGCLCLLTFSLASSLSAIIVERYLIQRFSIKTLYLVTFILYAISCLIIFTLENIYFIIPFCSSFGLLLTVLTTLPYQIISEFHQNDEYLYQHGSKRGLGTDCSLLSSCYFLAQAIISVLMSFLTVKFGNRVILIVGAVFGTVGLLITEFFVTFPIKCVAKII